MSLPPDNHRRDAKVYVVILNWNGWQHTVPALESVFSLTYGNFSVILCDNFSHDGSVEHIQHWASHTLFSTSEPDERPYASSSHGFPRVVYRHSGATLSHASTSHDFFIIQTGANLGFSGGINAGLEYARSCGDADYYWILNNDVSVANDALQSLVNRMNHAPNIGMCGSTLLDLDAPTTVQAFGGALYDRFRGTTRPLGEGSSWNPSLIDRDQIEQQLDYIAGASILISDSFLQDIGPLCEDYFLYFEELDWASRAKKRYALGYAPDSIVYHRMGASTGANGRSPPSPLSTYFFFKSRLYYVWKHDRHMLLSVAGYSLFCLLRDTLQGNFFRAFVSLCAILRVPLPIAFLRRS